MQYMLFSIYQIKQRIKINLFIINVSIKNRSIINAIITNTLYLTLFLYTLLKDFRFHIRY